MADSATKENTLTKKDFVPPVDVRWCPGCGDYAILSALQKVFPELGIPKEDFVVISGIGCASRFPYYMDTYGFHTIHGRAPSVATGVKVANPDLSVWMIAGDGDALSIGGNHLMHILRRNVDVNILLFNNRIYGLTKGQYSPTSESGKVTKTSPNGSVDYPIKPLSLALAAESTFVARTAASSPKHMTEVFHAAAAHKGVSFVEILQNCVIFNDKTFDGFLGKDVRDDHTVVLQDGEPLFFGKEKKKGISFKNSMAEIVTIGEDGITEDDVVVHDIASTNPGYAYALSQMDHPEMPVPLGVLRSVENREPYEKMVNDQVKHNIDTRGEGDLEELIKGKGYWEVKNQDTTSKAVDAQSVDTEEEDTIISEQVKEKIRSDEDPLYKALKVKLSDLLIALNNPPLITLDSNASIMEAINIFKARQIGCIPIVTKSKLVGILSERDIVLKVALKKFDREHTPVSSFMTNDPVILTPENTVGDAIHSMSAGGFRHMPIESNGKLEMVSIKGLMKFIYQKTHG